MWRRCVRPPGSGHGALGHTQGLLAASRARTGTLPLGPSASTGLRVAGGVRRAGLRPQASLVPSFCPDAFWPVSGMTDTGHFLSPQGVLPQGQPARPRGLLVPGAWILRSVWLGELSSEDLEPFPPETRRGSATSPAPLLARLSALGSSS